MTFKIGVDGLKNSYITKDFRIIAIFLYIFGIWIACINGLLIVGNILLLIKDKIYFIEIIVSIYTIIVTSLIYLFIYKIFFYRYLIFIEVKDDNLLFYTYKKIYTCENKLRLNQILFGIVVLQSKDKKKFFIRRNSKQYDKIKKYLFI